MNAPTTNLPAERKPAYGEVAIESHGGGGMLRPSSLAEVVDFAQLMAKADVAVPKHLRGNVGACVSVAMQAFRWEMDPFAVANKSYAVNDRLAYEAQLCAAVVNMRAPIVGRPDYVYEGEGPSRTCKVVCVMHDGEVREYTSPRFDKITTKNSPLWKSDPDQQLGYFAIRSWARRHTPEVLLGVYTPDELREETVRDVTSAPGLRERLNGPAGEGFTSANAPPDDPVEFAEQAEEIAEAEFEAAPPVDEQVDTPAADEPIAHEDPPGEEPVASLEVADASFDALDWAASFTRGLAQLSSVAEVEQAWKTAKAAGYVLKLQAKSKPMAEQLVAAVNERVAELKAAG